VDALLKLLADASMAVGDGEEALEEGANATARDRLDAAGDILADLRERWPELSPAERKLVGQTAAPLRARLDTAQARLPKVSALTEVAPEDDPEQESDPDADA
jgi:hypothetical protein